MYKGINHFSRDRALGRQENRKQFLATVVLFGGLLLAIIA